LKKHTFILILLLLTALTTLNAQTDTAFWFAAPDISFIHGDRPVVFRFASFDRATKIKISIPAQGITLKELSLAANSQGNFIITDPEVIEVTAGSISNKGILIQSTNPITSYYEVQGSDGNNTDIFALKGKYALGTDFLVPMQNYYPNQYNINAHSAAIITATEDNTIVKFTPSVGLFPNNSKVPITITLNKGQTYNFRAYKEDIIFKLTGSKIESNKPIAVTGSDDSVLSGRNWDLVGDQLIPFKYGGKKYVLPEGIIAVASKKATIFKTLGNSYALNDSNNFSLTFYNDSPQLIDFSDTVIVNFIDFISSNSGSELGGAIIPPINCSGSREVSFVRSSEKPFFLYLVYRTNSEESFLLNNAKFPIDKSLSFKLDSNLSYVKLPVEDQNILAFQSYRISNTKAPFHLGIGNGSQNTGYQLGYFSNFRNEILDTIFVCEKYSSFEEYKNTLNLYGNISIDTLNDLKADSLQVKFRVQDEYCVFEDSAWLVQSQRPVINIADTLKICNNIDSTISFNEYIVQFNNILSNSKSTLLKKDSVNIYLENKVGCYTSKTVHIKHLDSLKVSFPNDTSFCKNDSTEIKVSGNFDSFAINNTSQNLNPVKIKTDTPLSISLSNQCGTKTKSIKVSELKLPIIDLGQNTTLCTKKHTIYLPDTFTYLWNDGNTNFDYHITQSGTYSTTATNIFGCTFKDSINLIIKNFDSIIPTHNFKICPNKQYEIILEKGHDQYVWDDGNNDSIRYLSPGIYSFKVETSDEKGICYTNNSTFEVSEWKLSTPNIITPNNDNKNETFVVTGMDKNYPLKFQVYNRWGGQVSIDEDYKNNWGNQELSTGVYYYSTEVKGFECTKIKGYVLIER
jgi:gliding motility-associated-like protein